MVTCVSTKDPPFVLKWPLFLTSQVPVLRPMDLMVEATPRRVFANAHTYHINSISVNSDYETYMSADDLRINLWNFEITNQSFSILSLWPMVKGLELRVNRYEWGWGIRWNGKEQSQLYHLVPIENLSLWEYTGTCYCYPNNTFGDILNYQQWAITGSGLQLWVSCFMQWHLNGMQ